MNYKRPIAIILSVFVTAVLTLGIWTATTSMTWADQTSEVLNAKVNKGQIDQVEKNTLLKELKPCNKELLCPLVCPTNTALPAHLVAGIVICC